MVNYPGMISPGNIDIANRPKLQNEDGSYSTMSTITIGVDGKTALIPTVIDGIRYSNKEAIDYFKKTNESFGIFDSEQSANKYDEQMHKNNGLTGAKNVWENKMPNDLLPNIPNALGLVEPGNAPYTPGPAGDVSYGKTKEGMTAVVPYGQIDQNQIQSFMLNHPEHLGIFDSHKNATDYVNNMDVRSAVPSTGVVDEAAGGGPNYLSPQQSWNKMEQDMGGSPQAQYDNMLSNIGLAPTQQPATPAPSNNNGASEPTAPQTGEGGV